MTSREFCNIAGKLMRCPAVAFHEHAVRDAAERLCIGAGLEFKRDRFGNLLVRLQTDRRARPMVLAAHMDHPGFEMVRRLSDKRWLARFLGGVPDKYFRPGIRLRLMPGGEPAVLGKRLAKEKEFEIQTRAALKMLPAFAVWELEDFAVRKQHIHGRACDDLGGVAAILATLIELKRSRARVNVIGVISRAEEIGFRGALAIAAGRELPKNSFVISLETSRELPGTKIGNGVILRVGDYTSIFDSDGMRFLGEVAGGLAGKDKSFCFQRALMSGGTCEATAYQEFGYQTAAVCVALGNYHNCSPRGRIEAEYISIADGLNMVGLFVSAARRMPRYAQLTTRLPARLRQLLKQGKDRLLKTA